ncbi:MAG: hypothetical protein RBU37_00670 [Myxococcota bacterium]|nr:hypothetical protein [Myxococcota bacterium]
MSSEWLERSVDELEISVRASHFIQQLGVSTVAELLALPNLAFPPTWSAKTAQRVRDEVLELLSELGLAYHGVFELPDDDGDVDDDGEDGLEEDEDEDDEFDDDFDDDEFDDDFDDDEFDDDFDDDDDDDDEDDFDEEDEDDEDDDE